MKKLLFAFCLLSMSVFGQYTGGTLSNIVNGSTVVLKIDSADRNCGAEYDQQIYIHGDSITWLQVDFGFCYGCICLFNYSVTIDSLSDGEYTAVVYYTLVSNEMVYDSTTGTWGYTHIPRDTTYLGLTNFTISNSSVNSPIHSASHATPCLLTKINESKDNVHAPFPNPTSDFIYLQGMNDIEKIEIYDILGQTAKANLKVKLDNIYEIDMSSLNEGIYFIKYSSKIFKVIKLKK